MLKNARLNRRVGGEYWGQQPLLLNFTARHQADFAARLDCMS